MEGLVRHSSISNFPRSGELNETERQRVHAVAESGRFGTVIEEMAEMCVAQPAQNLNASHIERKVGVFAHILLGNRLPEAGPARARLEFGIRAEERRAAADATVESFIVIIPILAGKGAFRGCMTCHFERSG